jgi:ketosteroid isomerase-like protein
VQLGRGAFESFNRRDLAGAVAALERDAEWVPYLAALEEEIYRGRDDMERMWREVLIDVPDFQIEFLQVVADSPDTVVLEVEPRGMGKASQADIRTNRALRASPCRDGLILPSPGGA